MQVSITRHGAKVGVTANDCYTWVSLEPQSFAAVPL